jgi:hypothetical protein
VPLPLRRRMEMFLLELLANARSIALSPLKSSATTALVPAPALNVACGLNVPSPLPRRTLAVPWKFAWRRRA